MEDLIKRLEMASGPSRELDAEIALAIGAVRKWIDKDGDDRGYEYTDSDGAVHRMGADGFIRRYTASLDAAVTLIPGTWQWDCGTCNEDDLPWACLTNTDTWVDYAADGWSPILAICIAAMKARI